VAAELPACPVGRRELWGIGGGVDLSILQKLDVYARELAAIPRLIRQRGYSAYGEDSVFFAALKPRHLGFYVDVGAHHPKFGSNTYRLYRHGWSGLVIEPNPQFAAAFRRIRPRDQFIGEGVSADGGALTYYQFENSVNNTFSVDRAADLSRWGQKVTAELIVPTRPLAEILQQYAPHHRVDFLSVDCEGLDLDVLQSADLLRIQPTTIIVEDFEGLTTFKTAIGTSKIDEFLRDKGYQPIAQMLYSRLYISRNWRELSRCSGAYDETYVQQDMFPQSI
jgi:FkbM family methyltransferase